MDGLTDSRSRFLALVESRPGLSVTSLARELAVDPSTARYHLHRLERRKTIVGRAHGRERVYYPMGTVCPMLRAHWPTLARHRDVAEAVASGRGTVAEVAPACGMSEGRVRSRLIDLQQAGFLERPTMHRYAAADDLPSCLAALDAGGRCGKWGRCSLSRGRWVEATPPAAPAKSAERVPAS